MRRLFAAGAGLVALVVIYLLAWPVPVEPVSWTPPPDEGLTGAFSANELLGSARHIDLGIHEGPEDVAAGTDGYLYATTKNGAILRIAPARRSVEVFADAGGRPLGVEPGPDGSLYVANAIHGIQRVAPDGSVTTLVTEIDGQPLRYADDLAVAADGRIYFSEASTRFGAADYGGTLESSLLDILEHGGNGLVAFHDPATGETRVLLRGLNFANGVAISDDQRYLLVAETGSYRILRHWLEGPDAGNTEVLIDNLPGFPDNINNGRNGRFWIGLVAPRNPLLDRLADKPFLRRVVQRLPAFVRPRPVPSSHVFAIDGEGTVLMSLQDPAARYPMLTGVLETPRTLYLSALTGNRLAFVDKAELL